MIVRNALVYTLIDYQTIKVIHLKSNQTQEIKLQNDTNFIAIDQSGQLIASL
jgi:hypothetical protein